MGCQRSSGALHLAAEFLHFLSGGGYLLSLDGAKLFVFFLQTFEALLSLGNLALERVILIL